MLAILMTRSLLTNLNTPLVLIACWKSWSIQSNFKNSQTLKGYAKLNEWRTWRQVDFFLHILHFTDATDIKHEGRLIFWQILHFTDTTDIKHEGRLIFKHILHFTDNTSVKINIWFSDIFYTLQMQLVSN